MKASSIQKANEGPSKAGFALNKNIMAKAKSLGLESEQSAKEREREMMKEMDPKEAAEKLAALRKERSVQFYRDLKLKRAAKIKSKTYHKLKKKRKTEEERKKMEALAASDPSYKLQLLEEEEKERIKERALLRHRNKSKKMTLFTRFGDKNELQ